MNCKNIWQIERNFLKNHFEWKLRTSLIQATQLVTKNMKFHDIKTAIQNTYILKYYITQIFILGNSKALN